MLGNSKVDSDANARIITLVTSALLTSEVSGTCQAETAQQRGKVIAQGLCSRAAIETTGDSPHPAAPRFRSLDDKPT